MKIHFRPKTKMAETIKNSHFRRRKRKRKRISVGLYRRYQTSPALYTPIISSQPIGRIAALRIFQNPICACLAYWMIPSAAWRYWQLNGPFCSERGCSEYCQWSWMTRTTPCRKNGPFLWDFFTLLEEDRAMAIGNMRRKIGKDRACGSGFPET